MRDDMTAFAGLAVEAGPSGARSTMVMLGGCGRCRGWLGRRGLGMIMVMPSLGEYARACDL